MRLLCVLFCQFRRSFHNNRPIEVPEILRQRQSPRREVHPQLIAESHLRGSHSDTAVSYGFHGRNISFLHFLVQEIGMQLEYVKVRHSRLILGHPEKHEGISCLFQLLADRFRSLSGSNSKGNKRRRYMEIIKRTAHGIFAPDGTKTESRLHMECTKKSSSRFSPACPVCQFFKIFLEREVCPAPIRSHCHEACHGKKNRIYGAMERTPLRQIRIKAVCHEACAVRLAPAYRKFSRHSVSGRLLIPASKRHKNCPRSDSRIKTFCKSLLGRIIQVTHGF